MLFTLLQKLTGQTCNDALSRFLYLDERLVDIGDDLVDYEVNALPIWLRACQVHICLVKMPDALVQEDVQSNSFNILRGVSAAGASSAGARLQLLAKFASANLGALPMFICTEVIPLCRIHICLRPGCPHAVGVPSKGKFLIILISLLMHTHVSMGLSMYQQTTSPSCK